MLFRFLISGALAGSITGILSTGGGLILVPALSPLCARKNIPVFPVSISVILPICVTSLFFQNTSPLSLQDTLPYLIGSFLGGLIAAFLRPRIPSKWLHRILSIFILWGGIRFLCSSR